jgi:hypothetical protein
MKPSDDDVVKTLLAARPGAETCPDAGLIVGWAEGRLEPERSHAVDEHLASCDACREEALLLRGELRAVAPAAAPRRSWALRLLKSPLAIAALALATLGVGVWAFARQGDPGVAPADTETRFVALAERLVQRDSVLFSGLVPQAVRTLDPAPERALRGGVSLLGLPRSFLHETRPTFRWEAVAGAEGYEVRLLDAQGRAVVSARSAGPAWTLDASQPALERGGKYVLEVRTDAALGPVVGRRGFAVASEEEVSAFERATQRARDSDADLSDLVRAHLALARGYTLEAQAATDAYLVRHPDDRAGLRLKDHLRATLGLAR